MKKWLLILALCFANRTGYSQSFLYPPKCPVIQVPVVDTPFIRVFTTFLVDERGMTKDIVIQKIECSVCSDSLLSTAKNYAIRQVQGTIFSKGVQGGKAVKVRYNLPVLLKFPFSNAD